MCVQRAHQKYAYWEILEEPWAHVTLLMGKPRYLCSLDFLGLFVCLFLWVIFFFKKSMGRISPCPPSQRGKNYPVMNAGLLLGHVLTDLLLGGRCFHSKTIILNGTVMQQRCCGGPGDHLPALF